MGGLHVTLAPLATPSEKTKSASIPIPPAALFQFAAGFAPAISVGPIGTPLPAVRPPTKSTLMIRRAADPPLPAPPVPTPPVPNPPAPELPPAPVLLVHMHAS